MIFYSVTIKIHKTISTLEHAIWDNHRIHIWLKNQLPFISSYVRAGFCINISLAMYLIWSEEFPRM